MSAGSGVEPGPVGRTSTEGRLRGDEARLRAVLLVGQILVFIYAPAATGRYFGWGSFDVEKRDAVRRQLRQVVRAQLSEEEG